MTDINNNEFYSYKSLEWIVHEFRTKTKKIVRKMRRAFAKGRPYYAKGWRTKITLKRRIKK